MSSIKTPFKLGDSVRFKDGQQDEQLGTDIGGWQGRIAKIDAKHRMLLVEFDSVTLNRLPREYLEECEEEGLSWSEYYIEFHNVELVQQFPFYAAVSEWQKPGSVLQVGQKVKVIGIVDLDEGYGVLVKVRKARSVYIFPLCDLEVLPDNSPNHHPVHLYAVWFANR